MKRLLSCSLLVVLLVTKTVSASVNEGTWSKPSDQITGGMIYAMCSTGDYLWLLTDEGVGKYHTRTGDVQFYPLSVLDLGESYYADWSVCDIAAGDSEHVVIFEREDPASMQYFNGSRWQRVDFGCRCTEPSIEKDGSVWIAKDGGSDDSADTLLFFTAEGKRDIVPYILPDTFSVRDVKVDGNGIVWLAGYVSDGGVDGSATSYAVYRFDDRAGGVELIGRLDQERVWKMWTDTRKQIRFSNGKAIYTCETGELVPYIKELPLGQIFSIPVIDSDGNIWYWTKGTDGPLLVRITMNDNGSYWLDTSISRYNQSIAACDNGVYVSGSDGFWRFGNKDTIGEFISGSQIWGACSGTFVENILFGKDNVGFLMPKVRTWENGYILKYTDGTCRHLRSAGSYYQEMIEGTDGTLIMSGETDGQTGFFVFADSGWQLMEGTENLVTYSKFIEDRSGKIWAGLDTKILHQTSDGWELINSENSNLPPFGADGFDGHTRFVQDKNGYIWGLFNRQFAAKTLDGYDWEIVTGEQLGGGVITEMGLHANGMVQFLVLKNCPSAACKEMVRVISNGTGWDIETLSPPENRSVNQFTEMLFLDSRGDLWLDGTMYRFTVDTAEYVPCYFRCPAGATRWIRYDFQNVPYRLSGIIGEDVRGNVYFRDVYNEVVVYNRDDAGSVDRRKVLPRCPAFSVKNVSGGYVTVEMSIKSMTRFSLSLISINGRLVAHLDEGFLKTGVKLEKIRLTSAPGVYLIRFEANDATQTVPIVIR